MERSKQLAALFLVGAFLAGVSIGFTWDRTLGPALGARPAGATVASASTEHGALDAFSTELALTAAQRAAVDSILDERHRIIDSLVAPMRPQIEAARESARAQIRLRLRGDQQARFDRYLARLRASERAAAGR